MRTFKWISALCALTLALALAGCGEKKCPDPVPTPAPAESETPADDGGAALAALLAGLSQEDVGFVSWPTTPAPAAEDLAELLAQAAAAPLKADDPAVQDPYPGLWSAALSPNGAVTDSADDALRLDAGLAEDVIRITGGKNLPAGTLIVRSPELYQLLRTSLDAPARVDQVLYARGKGLIDHYYNALLENYAQLDGGFDRWELHTLIPADTSEALRAEAWLMTAAVCTPVPEDAPRVLAGGMYVDSALRVFGMSEQSALLVMVDEKPAGILPRDPSVPLDRVLDAFTTPEELKASFWDASAK